MLESNHLTRKKFHHSVTAQKFSKKFMQRFFKRKVLYLKALIEGKLLKCFLVLHVKCQHCCQSLLLSLENKLNSIAHICLSDRFINLSKRYSLSYLSDLLKYLLRKI